MKTLLTVLSVLALSATAFAYPGPNSIGMYADGDAASVSSADLLMNTAVPFESVTLYLCITNPTSTGVSGWEATVNVMGTATAPSWELSAGLDVDPSDAGFQVGIGTGGLAINPNGNGSVVLATWTAFVLDTSTELAFFIDGIPGSQSFPSENPGYADGGDAGLLVECMSNVGGFANACFIINSQGTYADPVGNEDRSFSEVKNLFR